jgi:Family of unknown function (DUF5994)
MVRPPRLMLKPAIGPMVASTCHIDGAWWPRSRNLAGELPMLAKALAAWLGRVERVSYNLTVWRDTVRQIRVDSAPVRLDGNRMQHPDTVDVLGHTHRITLLVVPPEATEVAGHQATELAATRPTLTARPGCSSHRASVSPPHSPRRQRRGRPLERRRRPSRERS